VREVEQNLAALKAEIADRDRRHVNEVTKHQAEYTRLIEANTEKQKEVNRLDKELDQRKRELADVNAALDKWRQKLNGA
jgi:hypothetical protein